MPNYIMLAHYTERGRRMGRTNPNLLTEAAARVETPSGRILTQYAVLGRYDFVIIAEAADNQSALRLSLDLGGLAGINIETLAALPIGVITHREPAPTPWTPAPRSTSSPAPARTTAPSSTATPTTGASQPPADR